MTAQPTTTARRTRTATLAADRKPTWISYPDAAELTTLSVRSLKRLTAAGKLRCYVVGGKVLRLRLSDVEALFVPADQCRGW